MPNCIMHCLFLLLFIKIEIICIYKHMHFSPSKYVLILDCCISLNEGVLLPEACDNEWIMNSLYEVIKGFRVKVFYDKIFLFILVNLNRRSVPLGAPLIR